ncbi:hypothetical protein [Pseudomonas aegrilactucae]|uniref:Gfo/Idh/MocA-like oxidoreductase N-terminal domain-containing protein n=1 Tax=Pseudomonas aegrilactucae TaxID=2854028 RepID=A0A9Q3ACU8_9PSED|nr:hypothetical protein [Pseudomonas aegrilactucae]MBV6286804.1 hypothetical protein [Pseudomonas aegrilactucae]
MKTVANPSQRLRLGFVGGGLESSIGATHRYAAQLDGHFELVAGVFARDPARNRAAAEAYGVAPERVYADYQPWPRPRQSARTAYRQSPSWHPMPCTCRPAWRSSTRAST